LIYINIAVFLLITFAGIIGFLMKNEAIGAVVFDLLAVPASPGNLIYKPWSPITYMFTHKDIWHILFNMVWFYWFGKIFLEYFDSRKLVAVYVIGGLSGAALYILSFNIFPAFTEVVGNSVAIGASASVMAVVIAIAVYVPNYPVHLFLFGRIKIIWIALGILILTSFMDISVNSGGKLAHIGGAIFGYFFTVNIRKGKDAGKWLNRIFDFLAGLFKKRKKLKVTYKRPVTDYDYNKTKTERQARINIILDKISKGGYDSISKEEKDLLFRESQK
jgi:membrane associated rhomboid family serine protease